MLLVLVVSVVFGRSAGYPDQRLIRVNRANSLAEQGRSADAVREYERLLHRHPDDPVVLVNLARCLVDAGDPAAAVPYVERAAALDPENPTQCLRAGCTQRLAGRPAAAARWYRKALALNPGDPVAVAELTEVVLPDVLARFRSNDRDVDALVEPGLFHAREGDTRTAVDLLGRAASIPSPRRAECHDLIGRVRADAGERDAALRALDRALRLAPGHPEATRLRELLR